MTATTIAQPTAPERTIAQRMEALKRGNEIRVQRARLKKELKAGRLSPLVLIIDPPECLMTAKVADFLIAMPKHGRVKAHRILAYCRISPSKTISGMSERQRKELVGVLGR